ncbi:MAG: adenylate kinase family protein [Candidatus Bathyarchaeota archaeon]|nr:adenylate kinase family protein [Candidatus Bathyarchaeota archaeon]
MVVTGTPGVGKSSVSAALASRINAHLVSLGELIRGERLYLGFDRERDTLIADMEKVSRRVSEIISSVQKDIVIEGHLAVDAVPAEEASIVFVLRRKPEELKKILEERSYTEKKIMENLAAEILDVCLFEAVKKFGVGKVCEIDVTSKSVDEVVEEILDVLSGLRECRVGVVDWLGDLEAEGKLEEYLGKF